VVWVLGGPLGEDSFSADHALAGLDVDGAGGGDVEVGAGAETNHAETLSCLDGFSRFFPADDATGNESSDLADEDGSAGGAEEPSLVLVTDIDLEVACVEEFASGIVGFFDGGSERSAVDVDIEDGEKDADTAELAEAEAGVFGLVDADYFTIGWADEGKGVGRWGAFGIAEEKQEANDEKNTESSGDPPSEPDAEATKGGGDNEEGSCFTDGHG